MKRVTGIGGIFFQARDPAALRAWYKTHLGIEVQAWGGAVFTWTDSEGNSTKGTTAWSIGPADGKQFAPSKSTFMVNYRVDNLDALLQALRDEGCDVLEKTDDSEYGKFGWVIDPEGNKVELWQPPRRAMNSRIKTETALISSPFCLSPFFVRTGFIRSVPISGPGGDRAEEPLRQRQRGRCRDPGDPDERLPHPQTTRPQSRLRRDRGHSRVSANWPLATTADTDR